MIDAARSFVAEPTEARFSELAQRANGVHGRLEQGENEGLVRETGVRAAHLIPLLGAKPTGRGHARSFVGWSAARWLSALVVHGVEPRAETFALLASVKGRAAREMAWYARCLADLHGGSVEEVLEAHDTGDAAALAGAHSALASMASRWWDDETLLRVPFEPLESMYRAALAPKSPHLPKALMALWFWIAPRRHSCEIRRVIGALLTVQRSKAGPQARKRAWQIVERYAMGIAHGRGADDPRVAGLVARARERKATR